MKWIKRFLLKRRLEKEYKEFCKTFYSADFLEQCKIPLTVFTGIVPEIKTKSGQTIKFRQYAKTFDASDQARPEFVTGTNARSVSMGTTAQHFYGYRGE
jgi:hypothetical protein